MGDLDPVTDVSLDIGFTYSTLGIPIVMPKPGEPQSQVHLANLSSVVASRIDFYAGKPMRNKGIR